MFVNGEECSLYDFEDAVFAKRWKVTDATTLPVWLKLKYVEGSTRKRSIDTG